MSQIASEYESLIREHLDHVQDIELVFLKGHLLIEQCLTLLLELQLVQPKRLRPLNLMFNKKLEVYLSISGNSIISYDLEHVLKEMNSLRNKLTHNFRHPEFNDQLRSWLQAAAQRKIPDQICNLHSRRQLVEGISYIVGFLVGAISGIKASKKTYVNSSP